MLDSGVVDALIVAEAALIRLGATDRNRILLSHETEPLQGKLAIVARSEDGEMTRLFASIDSRRRYENSSNRPFCSGSIG